MVHRVNVDSAPSHDWSGSGNVLAAQADVFHRDAGSLHPCGGQLAGNLRRLDRQHAFHLGRVGRHVEARAEADLDDGAEQPVRHGSSPALQFGGAAGAVDQAGEDVFAIQAHAGPFLGYSADRFAVHLQQRVADQFQPFAVGAAEVQR